LNKTLDARCERARFVVIPDPEKTGTGMFREGRRAHDDLIKPLEAGQIRPRFHERINTKELWWSIPEWQARGKAFVRSIRWNAKNLRQL
jgi:hypothetical protein